MRATKHQFKELLHWGDFTTLALKTLEQQSKVLLSNECFIDPGTAYSNCRQGTTKAYLAPTLEGRGVFGQWALCGWGAIVCKIKNPLFIMTVLVRCVPAGSLITTKRWVKICVCACACISFVPLVFVTLRDRSSSLFYQILLWLGHILHPQELKKVSTIKDMSLMHRLKWSAAQFLGDMQ